MSGTTIISSTLPVAVLCTGTIAGDGLEPYTVSIEGTNGPDAVSGVGITYNVDLASFNFWIAGQVEVGLQVKPISQADLDTLAQAQGLYGFELGLTPPGTLAAEGVRDIGDDERPRDEHGRFLPIDPEPTHSDEIGGHGHREA